MCLSKFCCHGFAEMSHSVLCIDLNKSPPKQMLNWKPMIKCAEKVEFWLSCQMWALVQVLPIKHNNFLSNSCEPKIVQWHNLQRPGLAAVLEFMFVQPGNRSRLIFWWWIYNKKLISKRSARTEADFLLMLIVVPSASIAANQCYGQYIFAFTISF